MKYLVILLVYVIPFFSKAQALRDINYNYEYNPNERFTLQLKPVRFASEWKIFYKLEVGDTTQRLDEFTIQWQGRDALSDKEAIILTDLSFKEDYRDKNSIEGSATIPFSAAPKILVAKVIETNEKRAWLFYKTLENNYPTISYALKDGRALFKPYLNLNQNFAIPGSDSWIVSYYNDVFPPASPGFAESQGRVAKAMKTDSTFFVNGGQALTFNKKGLYLIQKDTNSAEGFSFRVEDDYPRLSKVQSLAQPFIYLCTKQEYDKLVAANGDKKAFDRTVLNITNDTDRARDLMRVYFRRVEMANQYFTSYKEGWKTDRGMIFIIFGTPNQVLKFYDREVWSYSNDVFKVAFNFSKASSVFDPDNYVLIRDKKYQETWYEVIDLWRSARFR